MATRVTELKVFAESKKVTNKRDEFESLAGSTLLPFVSETQEEVSKWKEYLNGWHDILPEDSRLLHDTDYERLAVRKREDKCVSVTLIDSDEETQILGLPDNRPVTTLSWLTRRPMSVLSDVGSIVSKGSKELKNVLLKTFTGATNSVISLDTDISSVSGHSSIFKKVLVPSENGDNINEEKKSSRCYKYTINPHGTPYFWWMGVLFIAYLYNALTIPLRSSFTSVQGTHFIPEGQLKGPPEIESIGLLVTWLLCDMLCDVVFIIDIIFVQMRLKDESKSKESKKNIAKMYISLLLSSLPLEILYAVPILRFNVLLRLPRLIRARRFYQFVNRYENSTKYPHSFRLVKIGGYLFYIVHIYTCLYYSISAVEGFGTNEWVYNGQGNSYLHSFYWAFLTVAAIHNIEPHKPVNTVEYIVELLGYLSGTIIIAVIISEIGNLAIAVNHRRLAFRRGRDQLKQHMKFWDTEKYLQSRVQLWYDFAANEQYIMDEDKVLAVLQKKMRSDLIIGCILDTLSKVKIFQGFEKTLLRELVLKLRPVLYIPGDYICRKGEIGKEMYIVNKGFVVVIGDDRTKVLAELGPGSVFGEISLLAVGGGNRRTANVKSIGFTSVFVLSKDDVQQTLVDYPDAQETLRKRGKYLLRQDKKRDGTIKIDLKSATNIKTIEADNIPMMTSSVEKGTLKSQIPQIELHEAIVHYYENPSLSRERKTVTMQRQTLRKTPSEPRKKIFSQLETSYTFSGIPHTEDTNRLDLPIHDDSDADSLMQLVTQSELKDDTTPGGHHYSGNLWPDVHTIRTRGHDTSDIVYDSTNVSKSVSKAENMFLGRHDQEESDSGETGGFLSTQPWETVNYSVSGVFSEENIKL